MNKHLSLTSLLTAVFAVLLHCLTIPPVQAALISNPNVAFIENVKAGKVTEEEMARVKYVRELLIEFLQKASNKTNQQIQHVDTINKSVKGMIDLFNLYDFQKGLFEVKGTIQSFKAVQAIHLDAATKALNALDVEKGASVSNPVITGTVENDGWISNTTIQAGATLKGGVLTGYITNEGTVTDIEFVGALLKGGTLAGHIVNNSRVGGKIQDVKLAPGTTLKGGILAGQIEGDCQQPALLEKVKVKKGSVLKCVELGKEVTMEKGVTVEKP